MRRHFLRTAWLVCSSILLIAATHASAAESEIVSITKIWNAGQHNAFTDLIRFRDAWYCSFREADGHVRGDGRLRVLVSTDGESWQSAALVAEEGIDLRDPKLSTTPDGRLMMVAGGSVYKGTQKLQGRQPRVLFSTDGRQWSAPQRVLTEGEWLWRVTWHNGRAYGTSYNSAPPGVIDAKDPSTPPIPVDWTLTLVAADDGVNFKQIARLNVPGHPNETTLRFLKSGELMALVRREGSANQNKLAWIGVSQEPYTQWKWVETKFQIGGPNFIELPNGRLWAAGRRYDLPDGAKTELFKMDRNSLTPMRTFPSGGDTSYPGLVWHDNLLWMSFYSSHEGKASIYLARIKLGE